MAANITIDGNTYTGIESVSVNGNVFGEGSSEFTEEILRKDFDPNGQSFIDTVNINLARGDYIETQFDITDQPVGRICFSVGSNIAVWPSPSNKTDVISVYTSGQDIDFYGLVYMHTGEETTLWDELARSTNRTKPYGNNIAKIKIDAAGLWFNDVLVKPSEYETYNPNVGNGIYPARSALLDASTLQVGAAQSDTDFSYAHYDYIKVCRKNVT